MSSTKQIDFRNKENRTLGFDLFYRTMLETNDFSPDITVEKWILDKENASFEKRCANAFFYGATYACTVDTLFTHKFPIVSEKILPEMIEFFEENKKRLLFASDTKYRKMVFPKFLESVCESLEGKTLGDYIKRYVKEECSPETNYKNLQEACFKDWYHWGRMGHWSFSEALYHFCAPNFSPPTMEFGQTGVSHTSGWAFCMGRDDLVERGSFSKEEVEWLEKTASDYIVYFKKRFPHLKNKAEFFSLETACCNYKRQHKGSRYGICYIDEQHTDLQDAQKNWPEFKEIWDLFMEGRQHIIPKELRFEDNQDKAKTNIAYMKSWHAALKNFGRMPRTEAWINKQPQEWCDLNQADWANQKKNSLEGFFK